VIENFFLCIGAQKSGTTWLARVMSQHPDLFLTPVKEVHYFDHIAGITHHLNAHRRWSRYRKYHQRLWTQWRSFPEYRSQWAWYRDYMRGPFDDAWYERLFAHRGSCRYAGELTPEYALIGEEGYRHLKRLAPAVRLLFIMRDPVQQTWSQILHEARAERIDANRLADHELIEMAERPRVRALRNYPATIANLRAVFSTEQILTVFYEDLHANRAAAIEQICCFIGLKFEPTWFSGLSRRINMSDEVTFPASVRLHLADVCKPIVAEVEQIVGRVPDAWHGRSATVGRP